MNLKIAGITAALLGALLSPLASQAQDAGGKGSAVFATDSQIADNAKAALAANKVTKGQKITVSAKDGAVTLSGSATSQKASDSAYETVSRLPSVSSVTNNIKVGK